MQSFISSLDVKQKNALNAALKSINNLVDFDEQEPIKQNFSEICFSGTDITKAEIKNPRKLGSRIPIIGNVCGIDIIVGYTDGLSISSEPIPSTIVLESTVGAGMYDYPYQDTWKNKQITVYVYDITLESGEVFTVKNTIVKIDTANEVINVAMRF